MPDRSGVLSYDHGGVHCEPRATRRQKENLGDGDQCIMEVSMAFGVCAELEPQTRTHRYQTGIGSDAGRRDRQQTGVVGNGRPSVTARPGFQLGSYRYKRGLTGPRPLSNGVCPRAFGGNHASVLMSGTTAVAAANAADRRHRRLGADACPACSALSSMNRNLHPTADACILIFLNGGPSHLDMWDMKPDAPAEIRGEFQPIATTVPGVHLSEHLPRLARQMHRCTLVRSVHHSVNNAHAAGGLHRPHRPRSRRRQHRHRRRPERLPRHRLRRRPAAARRRAASLPYVALPYITQGRRRRSAAAGLLRRLARPHSRSALRPRAIPTGPTSPCRSWASAPT